MHEDLLIFEKVRPVAAGYFQSDRAKAPPRLDPERQAAILYVMTGAGEWRLDPWRFPIRRGDLLAVPAGAQWTAHAQEHAPIGYYYAYFEAAEPEAPRELLSWPWQMGVRLPEGREAQPCASGSFRPELAMLFRQLQNELRRNHSAAVLAARSHLALIGIQFGRLVAAQARHAAGLPVRASGYFKKEMPEPLAQAVDHVEINLGEKLSLEELAKVARYSERRLVQLFRKFLGRSPMAYVRERRIREAMYLLEQGGLSIKEIAARLHFADAQHFSRVFRQVAGITPSEYAAGVVPVRGRDSTLSLAAASRNEPTAEKAS